MRNTPQRGPVKKIAQAGSRLLWNNCCIRSSLAIALLLLGFKACGGCATEQVGGSKSPIEETVSTPKKPSGDTWDSKQADQRGANQSNSEGGSVYDDPGTHASSGSTEGQKDKGQKDANTGKPQPGDEVEVSW